ncbi:hybrid-cluster NAD(P)-dependent oxidoreductase [Endozoicomonas sp. OPT23]|uniref:hybrid-cluster NAD(P)-dependent oxidoreductase n=1 Tax=Endozoicomonas sp. OPT23 TaxID=2072845 RepID=UPI00129B5423|nr:hybrid-cluster NAD(P)-dependent oxidoreductase [Endozoicomonas sp. OPT23]MRI35174.1 hybrid-cluster NAD(P)-dependent oxidoreductase [Endozoicomonas sp. OPT23]
MHQDASHKEWESAPLQWAAVDGTTNLICQKVIQETHDVKTFVFQTPKLSRFNYKAGQFVTLQLEIKGEPVSRTYTISSTPSRPYTLELTIKKVDGGKVSGWLLDNLKEGHRVVATAPAGIFNLADVDADKVLFLSAGCGITPMMSMSRWLQDTCSTVDARFIHSARSEQDIIFHNELELMAKKSSFFSADYVLEDKDGFLTQEKLQQLVPDLHSRTIFVCGPAPYMEAVKVMVAESGFNMDNYHEESFGGEMMPKKEASLVKEGEAGLSVSLQKSGKVGVVNPGDLLIDALEAQKAPVVAACRAGVCGACKVQIIDGEVESSSQMTLTPEEIEQGYVLSCCSTVKSDVAVAV